MWSLVEVTESLLSQLGLVVCFFNGNILGMCMLNLQEGNWVVEFWHPWDCLCEGILWWHHQGGCLWRPYANYGYYGGECAHGVRSDLSNAIEVANFWRFTIRPSRLGGVGGRAIMFSWSWSDVNCGTISLVKTVFVSCVGDLQMVSVV